MLFILITPLIHMVEMFFQAITIYYHAGLPVTDNFRILMHYLSRPYLFLLDICILVISLMNVLALDNSFAFQFFFSIMIEIILFFKLYYIKQKIFFKIISNRTSFIIVNFIQFILGHFIYCHYIACFWVLIRSWKTMDIAVNDQKFTYFEILGWAFNISFSNSQDNRFTQTNLEISYKNFIMLISYPLLCYYLTRIFCYLRPMIEKNLNFVNDRIDLLKYMNVKVLSGDITGRVV